MPMVIEAGHFALILALVIALSQTIVPFWGARTADSMLMRVGNAAAMLQCLLLCGAFAALTYAYVTSDFSVANVVANSHSAKPMLYKITGVWGNHEGSILLWALILSLFAASIAVFGKALPMRLKADVLSAQGAISVAFLLFIIITSNPFVRVENPPLEGRDLNPLLQDIGLAIHPPLLYLGYVGFSIAFSFAIAALVSGRIDAAWARWVRPWTLAAWVFLTLGIAMGSYWAYYELGWGGFWFWDPVENASLMPWISGTALLHSAVVMEKREALKIWTILLALLTFSLSLLGTFLVRSGVLTSVHAFAVDPSRGLFILVILGVFVGGSLALYFWRASALTQGGIFAPISREGALVLNNIFLSAACATVLVGTLYPLVLETLTDKKISVGEQYFNATFGPLMLFLMLFMPFGPLLAWKRGNLYWAAQRLFVAIGLGLFAGLVVAALYAAPVVSVVCVAVAAYCIVGSGAEVVERTKLFRISFNESMRKAYHIPGALWGSALGHMGVGICLLGIVGATTWNIERISTMKIGDALQVGKFTVILQQFRPVDGPNYQDAVATFAIRRGGVTIRQAEASKRFYTARQMAMTEASLTTFGFSQLYISLGDALEEEGAVPVRAEWKPAVLLIWIGPAIMALGGCISLSDRRLRVGIARRKQAKPSQPALEA